MDKIVEDNKYLRMFNKVCRLHGKIIINFSY